MISLVYTQARLYKFTWDLNPASLAYEEIMGSQLQFSKISAN